MISTSAVKEHPMLFSGPMVRAILEGRKTQMRRVIQKQPHWEESPECYDDGVWRGRYRIQEWSGDPDDEPTTSVDWCEVRCPYGKPGDTLWVREAWGMCKYGHLYRADFEKGEDESDIAWHPSIHMPRRLCRQTLCITDVRVQRVQEITEADAEAEGIRFCASCGGTGAIEDNGTDIPCPICHEEPYRFSFCYTWDSINAKRGHSWKSNPWVWVLTFEKVK
jgi:predicted RNA-binding Zn-ribbon protein involved in translation (DUF1610 family)